MKHVIIGTAGHIDHGKTTLIKALTGRDTDTLMEEKKRGISIDLGFTYFDLPSGRRAGIIDVPGHEKFIKNMLAGVSSIDIVILVIAADEGIMPQTKEHLEILEMLNVKKGVIALTKCDMVDGEWIELVKDDIRNKFKGTFLENAPIHEVSSKTKTGIKELIKDIDRMTEEVKPKDIYGHFRLPVDRVFTIKGFGTVVTGTIISGKVEVGQEIEIYPSKLKTKVRGLQVHDNFVNFAEAGQRCAINLSNVKVDEIKRGDVISIENVLEPSFIVDTKFHYINEEPKAFQNRQRIRFHHGTSEIIGRAIIMDKKEIHPGEDAYVQFRLEKPICCQRNDRFVIRTYSPMYTIGGGTIINPVAQKKPRFDDNYIKELKIKENGESETIIEDVVNKLSYSYPDKFSIIKALGKNEKDVDTKLNKLVDNKKVIIIDNGENNIYLHTNFIKQKEREVSDILEQYHKNNPLKSGMPKQELKNKVFGKKLKQRIFDKMIDIFMRDKIIDLHETNISKHNFKIVYNDVQLRIKQNIISIFKESKYNTPKYTDLLNREKNKKDFKMVFESLIENNVLIATGDNCVFLREYYDSARETIIQYIKENGSITTTQAKEIFNTTRKYIVSLLESFDNKKITKRVGNERVLYK